MQLHSREAASISIFTIIIILLFVTDLSAQITTAPANQDTIVIPGEIPNTTILYAGRLERTINGDTTATGARINPHRVYALNQGQYYYQQAPIIVNNPTGTITIVGVKSSYGNTKPVWMMHGITNSIVIEGTGGCNAVYGSLKFENIHYIAQQLDGTIQNENFYCGTKNNLPQSLTINNCLFEFANIDLFDCTDASGAIGGWKYGAKFRITNSYFRNLFTANQLWGSRIFQCMHPIDTLWVENVTTTGGGLTFLQLNQLTDFAYFNHNTIVNNHKYWILSPYYKTLIVTNNIFLNQNWVGEDSTVTSTGQDPDKLYMSTINLDTITWNNRVTVQPKYMVGNDTYSPELALNKLKAFVSNNINYWNPLLLEYFTNANNITGDGTTGYVNSWLDWGAGFQLPQKLGNMPCEWMNSRTQELFTKYAPPNGGFVTEAPRTVSPGSPTIDNIDAATRNIMMAWNQHMYSDPNFPTSPDALHSKMVFGDYDPATVPGNKTEDGAGITKFTDLTENWDATDISTIDGFPLGALIWNDNNLAAYNSAVAYSQVMTAYGAVVPQQPTTPAIISFTPTSGPIGTTVTINGKKFEPTTSNNIVYFGAVKATVSTATSTQLTVSVPIGATYSPITVTVNGLTAYASSPFIVTFPSSQTIDTSSFDTRIGLGTGLNPEGVAVGDIDGDSKLDIIVVNHYSNSVSIFRNTNTSSLINSDSFAPKVDFITGEVPCNVAVGDLDGDGKLDLVVSNLLSNTISVLRNTSASGSITTSSFTPKVDFTTGEAPIGVAICDLDGDGKPDLVTSNQNSNTVSVFRNTSTPGSITASSFAPKVDFTAGTGSDDVVIGDLDGDGKPDLVIANGFSGSGTNISLLRNTSITGSITANSFAPKVDFATGNGPCSIDISDIDGDGKLDLVVPNLNSQTVSVFKNTSTIGSLTASSFAPKIDFTTGMGPISVAISDLDGDGKPDIVTADFAGNAASILKNISTIGSITASSFAPGINHTSETNPFGVAIGDLNGDGKSDIVVADYNSNIITVIQNVINDLSSAPVITSHTPARNALNVAKNTNITVTFNTDINQSTLNNSTIKINGSLSGLHTCGFNYNSSTKTATITPDTQFKVGEIVTVTLTRGIKNTAGDLLISSNNWQFTIRTNIASVIFTQTSTTPGGYGVSTPASGDWNRDGYLDLAVSNWGTKTVSILMNNGSGQFTQISTPAVGTNPSCVTSGDWNGDGYADLAVTNEGSGTISILINNGNGEFTQTSTPGVEGKPYSVNSGDWNGDGFLDLAIANDSTNTVSIMLNNGSGQFTVTSAIKVEERPYSITSGDWNGDGYLDLVIANSNSETVSILINNGIGQFTQISTLKVGGVPLSVTSGDWNGDGYKDIAVANYFSNTASILLNNGSGQFTQTLFSEVGAGPFSINSGDWNGDGYLDLIVTNWSPNTVIILVNNGSGQFMRTSTIVVEDQPCSVISGDWNGDGYLDLTVHNANSGTVSILLNSAQSGNNLVAYYPFNGNANDLSGNGHNATFNDATLTTDRFGKNNNAYSFNGTSNTIQYGDILDDVFCAPVAKFSITGWANTRTCGNYTTGGGMLMSKSSGGGGIYQWNITHQENKVNAAVISDGIAHNYLWLTSPMSTNQWFQFALVFDGSLPEMQRLKLYVNGQSSNTSVYKHQGTLGTTTQNSTQNVCIGASHEFGNPQNLHSFYDGSIDDIRIYSRPLTQVEIDSLYHESGWNSINYSKPQIVFSTNVGGPVYAGISVLDENSLYAIASGDAVYRLNTDGSLVYKLQVNGEIRSASSIAYDKTIYIGSSDKNLYAFTKEGTSAWSALPMGGILTATPVIDSVANRLYTGVSNHNFIAVNRSTGKAVWNYFADDEIKNSAVMTRDRKLVFATQKGTLYGFDLKKLSLPAAPTWQIALPDTAPSSFALDKQGNIYLGTGSGILLKVALPAEQQPQILWQTSIGSSIVSAPVIDAKRTLYIGSTDSKLYAVDISSGTIKWSFATSGPIQSTPTISNQGNIFVANDDGEVYSLDSNQVVRWYYKANDAVVSPLLYYKSTLFFGTLGNEVIALYDSSQSSYLKKSSVAAQVIEDPIWSTFQGNSQRTGMADVSTSTGVENNNLIVPANYALFQNYPNPFNPNTVIAYDLPVPSRIFIKVYNVIGQELMVLKNGYENAGYHEVTFESSSLPSGIYFYQLTAGSYTQTKKMILMK